MVVPEACCKLQTLSSVTQPQNKSLDMPIQRTACTVFDSSVSRVCNKKVMIRSAYHALCQLPGERMCGRRVNYSQFLLGAQRALDHIPSAYQTPLAVLSALVRQGLFSLGLGTTGWNSMPCSIIKPVLSADKPSHRIRDEWKIDLRNKTA